MKPSHQPKQRSVTFKLLVIGILALVLLIPAYLIKSIIKERERYQLEAEQDISSKWGEEQTVLGPILEIPVTFINGNDKYKQTAKFLPEELLIKGNVEPEKRYRGIFEVLVYQTNLSVEGSFNPVSFHSWQSDKTIIHWNEAKINTGITDLKGLKAPIEIKWNGQKTEAGSLLPPAVEIESLKEKSVSFSYQLKFNGTKRIFFTPTGANTEVQITSPWQDPSFNGDYLPDEKTINENGFSAQWNILKFNRSYPQKWLGNNHHITDAKFGFELLKPVDQYQKSMRSVKYAILFIALTFITFFFAEQLSRGKMHPVQYLLVGIALLIFFTLLLALSEVISFNLSYIIAAVANIALISGFTHLLFKSGKTTISSAIVLVFLYSFLFSVLQLEQHALLIGSIGLFIIVALLMYLSLKVKWYDSRSED